VTGDPGELQQVVWDLLGRAIDGSDAGGRIEVRLERAGGEVRFVVSDTQAAAPPLRVVDGSVGSIIPGTSRRFDAGRLRRIVQEHHGRLTVEHNGAVGTSHIVTLPMRAVSLPAPTAGAEDTARTGAILADRRILIVDDNEDAREVLAAVLQASGARAETLASGEELLARLDRESRDQWPDLLLCDIGLEGQDGYSVMRHVRALEAERRTALSERMPAIALTGHVQPEDRMRALLSGFQLHLAKPVEPRELFAAIASLLDSRGPHRRRSTTR
jgi:ATP-binding cassette subfamily B protein